jgi:sterol desaturase/sphingolipid hydroxylase (fatty acid hydroxylase superfamily)
LLHRVPLLWRLHRVHHSDTVMDVSTALRFHPIEILASLGFKATIILLLGAPPQAVLAFEIVLGAGALFTHANLAMPAWLERPLRVLFVTPSLHMIHHSPNPAETNSNFGFSFSFWDRLFGSYRDRRLGNGFEVGLEEWRTPQHQTFRALLGNPWRN